METKVSESRYFRKIKIDKRIYFFHHAKMKTFSDRLQHLMDLRKKNQREVADGAGVYQSRVSAWLRGATESPRRDTLQKLSGFLGCRIEWLETGEGPIFIDKSYEKQPLKQVLQAVDIVYDLKEHDDQKEPVDIEDMVKMTRIVLQSETVYKPALASNIRAFHKAVIMEGDMNEMKGDIKKLTEMVASLTVALEAAGITVPAKREPTAQGGNSHSS